MEELAMRTNILSEHAEGGSPFTVYTVGVEEQKPLLRSSGFSSYQLIVTFSGRGKFRLTGQSKWDIVDANHILFIPAHIPHEYVSEGYERWIVGFVSFSSTVNAMRCWKLGDKPELIAVEYSDRLFEIIKGIWSHSGVNHDYWTSSELILTFLSEMAKQRHHSLKGSLLFGSNAVSHTAARFLRDYVNRPTMTITELASQLGYSRKQLTRLFISSYNTTPLQYLKEQRLIGAARLLKTTPDKSVAEIARQVGMEPVYFSRAFKNKFGVTPVQFKQSDDDFNTD